MIFSLFPVRFFLSQHWVAGGLPRDRASDQSGGAGLPFYSLRVQRVSVLQKFPRNFIHFISPFIRFITPIFLRRAWFYDHGGGPGPFRVFVKGSGTLGQKGSGSLERSGRLGAAGGVAWAFWRRPDWEGRGH